MKADIQSARGEPRVAKGVVWAVKVRRVRTWDSVMSRLLQGEGVSRGGGEKGGRGWVHEDYL